ncbi:hypothetical protein ACEPAI_5803 [Sanghuangporus weigelae]
MAGLSDRCETVISHTSAGFSDTTKIPTAPLYLSPRSADVVLSEIRPTRLSPDALRSVNVLLDELLWMILSMARSFATDQLKAAWSKLLPTSLGKEALLEAEVELRAYWDRTTNAPSRSYTENSQEFPIQPAFELLRLKCEAYSTFNDSDDDTDGEKRWQTKVTSTSGFAVHNVQYIAPAALYLTAIVEHVCEHVLSNTGRVASRDSSRSTATLQDLFLALCEDDAIYGLFKIMKVHNQIESQCNTPVNRPGRSRSIRHGPSGTVKGTSHANGTPQGSNSTLNGDSAAKPRVSSDSAGSGTAVATLPSSGARSSTEKSKTKKLFGRMSVDKDVSSQAGHESGHKRSASIISNGKRPNSTLDDGPGSSPSEVEFDELMRSGTTMKVSLTPDRLRTFDVYSKEKGRGISKVVIPPQQPSRKEPLQDSSVTNRITDVSPLQTPKNSSGFAQRQVAQDQEMKDNGAGEDFNSVRMHKPSKGAPPVSYEQPPHSRTRSTSASQSSVTSFGNHHAGSRKGSLGTLPVESVHSQSLRGVGPTSQHSKMPASMSSHTYSGKRVHQTASHDSIDVDLDSDDDGPVKKPATRRRAPTVGGVSSQTADLIDFLNSGPPDLPKAMSPTPTTSSSLDNKMKRGRLRSIVSRLKGGQSMDKLQNQASFEDFSVARKSPLHPPPAFVPPPLSAKRSLHSLSSFAQSQISLGKGPTPPVPPVTIPLSPPLSPSHSFGDAASPVRPRPSPTTLRKAVPAFSESEGVQQENGNIRLNVSRSADVSPPTPSKVENENPMLKAQQVKEIDEGRMSTTTNSSVTPTLVTPTGPKPSDNLHTPPPSYPSIHPSSKQPQRHALSPPSTPKAFAANATDLRRLMANASTADECRLLIDMFLAQAGLPMKDTDFSPDPKLLPTAQQESAVVEVLLGHSEAPQKDEVKVTRGASARESGAPPTPRSEERHSGTISHRKPVPTDHTAQVVLAEA